MGNFPEMRKKRMGKTKVQKNFERKNAMQNWWKGIFLIGIGGAMYYTLELVYRGYSHWSMFLLGGLCFFIIDKLYQKRCGKFSLLSFMITGGLIITGLEGITGAFVNLYLHNQVWDYSNLPLQLYGQVSLFFSLLWCVMTIPVIWLSGMVHYYVLNDEKQQFRRFRSVFF